MCAKSCGQGFSSRLGPGMEQGCLPPFSLAISLLAHQASLCIQPSPLPARVPRRHPAHHNLRLQTLFLVWLYYLHPHPTPRRTSRLRNHLRPVRRGHLSIARVLRERSPLMAEEPGKEEGSGRLRWTDVVLLLSFFSLSSR